MRSIELKGAAYAFPGAPGAQPFVLGPVDLRIEQGTCVFIVGDNGSGKTTLIKLLLGLYAPQDGTLLLNGEAGHRAQPRRLPPAVHHRSSPTTSSSRTCRRRAARCRPRPPPTCNSWRSPTRSSIADGRFSTLDLSTGQRKRLALIQAWVERRPVLVFDEWAADQDPTFRRIFYTKLLPDLKRLGRTIIVISHDDRYFHTADRIVRLEEGRIVELPVHPAPAPGNRLSGPTASRQSRWPGQRRHRPGARSTAQRPATSDGGTRAARPA